MRKILVNDTNIIIDLINIDLFETFLSLNYEFHTNDLIISEIMEEKQKQHVEELIAANKLLVAQTMAVDYADILSLQKKNLSFEDCSIWHYAQKVNGTLLTGDARLRKEVEKSKVDVRGILFVFDALVEEEAITKTMAVTKIKDLVKLNSRLPKTEIELRIKKWSN